MSEGELDPVAFASAFQRFVERMAAVAPPPANPVRTLVLEHLGVEDTTDLPSVRDQVAPADHVNLQLALNDYFADRPHTLVGLPRELEHYAGVSLAGITGGGQRFPLGPSSLAYVDLPVDAGATLPCLLLGLYLFADDGVPLVALVYRGERGGPPTLQVEVMSPEGAAASRFLAELARLRDELNAFRGKVLSFSFSEWGAFGVTFHPLPRIERDDVVLPEGDLAAIERHTVDLARHAGALTAAGHQLKRGLLLYGPPGTGKTFSVMYLCNRMPERTTVLLTGFGEELLLGQAMALARKLQPSMVVLEDVDLIAFERTYGRGGRGHPILFQLLNEMDGLEADADVIFVLTTNRPELLEPALAQRPGRIDQAVEIALPDADCRRRLFARYFRDVPRDGLDLEPFVAATSGVTASFVKELARRSSLEALGQGRAVVQDRDVAIALDDLLHRGTALLRRTLGAERTPDIAEAGGEGPADPGW